MSIIVPYRSLKDTSEARRSRFITQLDTSGIGHVMSLLSLSLDTLNLYKIPLFAARYYNVLYFVILLIIWTCPWCKEVWPGILGAPPSREVLSQPDGCGA